MDNQERAAKVKMILMDVDGTLTDGRLFVLPDGEELKAYHVKDGMGILLAHLAGLKTGVITGKTSKSLERRAQKLRMDEVFQGILDKKKALEVILERNGLLVEEVAYIGDDLSDLEVMESVGLAAAVSDAHPRVRENCHFLCRSKGGGGAVREFIEFILHSQGKWDLIEQKMKNLFDREDGP